LSLACSVAVSSYPGDGTTVLELLQTAQHSMAETRSRVPEGEAHIIDFQRRVRD
jgi:hypothetical protein